jgi:small subunit ribosomal protein S6
MPLYETVFIARQDVSTTQVEALTEGFATGVKERGGEVKKREYWGLRNLSYRIKKNRKGHYVLMNIEAPAPAVQEMERTMRLNEDVLRYITVRVDALEEGPSAMMQRRDERGDRDRDRGDRYGDRDRGPRRPREGAPGEGGGDGPRGDGPRGDGPRGDGPRGDGPRGEGRGDGPRAGGAA